MSVIKRLSQLCDLCVRPRNETRTLYVLQLTSLQSSTYENTLNIQEADYEANLRRDFKVCIFIYSHIYSLTVIIITHLVSDNFMVMIMEWEFGTSH